MTLTLPFVFAIIGFSLVAIAFGFVIIAFKYLIESRKLMKEAKRGTWTSATYTHFPDWTANEALILRTFLSSPTGTILLQRARAMESINAIKGANDVFHTQHSAGRTAGFSDAINWLESLASDQAIQSLSSSSLVNEQKTADGQQEEAAPVERRSF